MNTLIEELEQARLARKRDRRPLTQRQFLDAERAKILRGEGTAMPSLGKIVRGLWARKYAPINPDTAEDDINYTKALATTSTPGSYLLPLPVAEDVVALLAQFETMRAAGARIWPMPGLQKLDVAVGLANPQFAWTAQSSRSSVSDPTLASIAFDLKNLTALVQVSVNLLKAAGPQLTSLIVTSIAMGLSDAADAALNAPATLSGDSPIALMSASGITTINADGGSGNGGALQYLDLLAVIQKAADLKLKGPGLCWIMNGRSWLRVLSLASTASQPMIHPGIAPQPAVGYLLGYPVYVTAGILSSEVVGSNSTASHILFTNPSRTVHIGEREEIEVSVSDEFYFDSNSVGIRIARYCDWAFQPAAGVIVLQGIS
jgi:HK97 family phage major capsid protein